MGICSVPLIACRTRHPCGELGFLCVCVRVCTGTYSYLCTVWMSRCVTSLLPSVRGKGDLLSGCRLVSQAQAYGAAAQELSHWIPPFVHTNATQSKNILRHDRRDDVRVVARCQMGSTKSGVPQDCSQLTDVCQ